MPVCIVGTQDMNKWKKTFAFVCSLVAGILLGSESDSWVRQGPLQPVRERKPVTGYCVGGAYDRDLHRVVGGIPIFL